MALASRSFGDCEQRAPMPDVELMEVGTAGIRLAQELLTPCDRLIIVDAMRRGDVPGTVYVVQVESVDVDGRGRPAPGRSIACAGGREGARLAACRGLHRRL